MPVIVVCGVPCSGKTRRAEELRAYLQEKASDNLRSKIHLLNCESLNIRNKAEAHVSPLAEKMTRGAVKAEVERHVAKDSIVIVDYLNYIKGYRYELFCLSRSAATPHCVLWCDVSLDQARAWNPQTYPDDLLESLYSRFERPFEKQKWDRPLFTVHSEDATPLEEILAVVEQRMAAPCFHATRPERFQAADYMSRIESVTSELAAEIAKACAKAQPGDTVSVREGLDVVIPPTRRLTMMELRKIRLQFIHFAQLRTPDLDRIEDSFVEFIERYIEQ